MSMKTVSTNDATMNLGIILFNDKPYLAILHFRDPDGKSRPITDRMKRTSEVSLRLFQKVVDRIPREEGALISRVNGQGFQFGSTVINYTELKSQKEWQKFITYLENPMPADTLEELNEPGGAEVELVDLSPLEGVDTKKLAKKLYKRICLARDSGKEFPELTPKERLFLEYTALYKNYPKFLAGEFDITELSNLQNEFPS